MEGEEKDVSFKKVAQARDDMQGLLFCGRLVFSTDVFVSEAKSFAIETEINKLLQPIIVVKFNTAVVIYCRAKQTQNFYLKHSGQDREFKLNRNIQTKVTNAASSLVDAETHLWAFCKKVGHEMATAVLMDDVDGDEEAIVRDTLSRELETELERWFKALNVCFLI